MRLIICVLALAICGGFTVAPVRSDQPKAPDKKKPDPDRLKGMKAAITDIEAGKLILRWPPLPDSLQVINYKAILKKECGVEAEVVGDFKGAESPVERAMAGYNDVMQTEIEYRFGKGTLERLHKAAKEK
jgi:hypothetical protein